MQDNVCLEKHIRVDEKLTHHENWLKEHEGKIDRLETSDAKNSTNIDNLCKQLSGQTKAIWGLALAIVSAILGYFLR